MAILEEKNPPWNEASKGVGEARQAQDGQGFACDYEQAPRLARTELKEEGSKSATHQRIAR